MTNISCLNPSTSLKIGGLVYTTNPVWIWSLNVVY
jgi:hypothetical protein